MPDNPHPTESEYIAELEQQLAEAQSTTIEYLVRQLGDVNTRLALSQAVLQTHEDTIIEKCAEISMRHATHTFGSDHKKVCPVWIASEIRALKSKP